MSTVNAKGILLHYTLEGPQDAPVVVLAHSLGTTLALWSEQVGALLPHYRVLRYDTRGHGASGVPCGPYSLDQLGGDVVALLDALSIPRAHFCGVSMGGLTGLWLGIHAPHRFLSLTLANTAPRIATREGWLERADIVRREGMQPVVDGAPARWFTAAFANEQPERLEGVLEQLRHCPPEGYAASCEALAKADLSALIGHIRLPTLLIAGVHDPVTTPQDADRMAQAIGNARRVDLQVSHISNVEAAQAFNDALLSSLMMRESAKTLG
ncbi:MAG: 3-oxoadipate enol-lactonase [Rhodocyclaceae bacterium]